MDFQTIKQGRSTILTVPDLVEHITPSWFDLNWWQAQNHELTSAPGRGESFFIDTQVGGAAWSLVWRHYLRGGLIARFSEDRYWWPGMSSTRPYLELHLTADLFARGLAVPRPLAAQVQREGLFYRADLITQRLPDVVSMADALADNPDSVPWQRVGETIAQFHCIGLDHVDLNLRNILLGGERGVYLIDFDRCRLRKISKGWQQGNLERLQRSLSKLFPDQDHDSNWQKLLQGYGAVQSIQ